LTAVFLLAMATPAAPAGRIVVYGAHSGSHLKLTVRGQGVVVKGYMASRHPPGCRVKRRRMVAVCSLRGVSSIEVNMGPSGDMVEVLDRLPVSLTTYLGPGRDKFIGNGERDVCYPQGTRRNRCVGGPGNDICITGPRNSDCVGGSGNDYCKTSSGSDGCWGGPGRDVCHMGPGEDGCHGGPGNDWLFGGSSPDQLYGGPGFDHCDGGGGWGRSHHCEAGPRR
jgi:hemolysin type calcium-binding protein